ncbi:YqkE family protein [Paenibacillus sp. y28]|uniref:YqkE family protein n=1 Tax=Paenibacillus sp. y28 TaxID=3129110 RepID=UPI0030161370
MAKKNRPAPATKADPADKPATLKDLLHADVLGKLKAQADEWKAEEQRVKEEKRAKEEAARKAEQKRLDNNFEHLLNNSKMDWKKFK